MPDKTKFQELEEQLRTERDQLVALAKKVEEKGDPEEVAALQGLTQQVQAKQQQLEALRSAQAAEVWFSRQQERSKNGGGGAGAQASGGGQSAPSLWGDFGEVALAVRNAAYGTLDQRLTKAAGGQSEGIGADGGFLVPPEFIAELLKRDDETTGLDSFCRRLTTGQNAVTLPIDPTQPWEQVGIRSFWQGEAEAMTKTKKSDFQLWSLQLANLNTRVDATDDLLEDSALLSSVLMTEMPREQQWKIDHGIMFGTGVRQPFGIHNSGALVVVPKETGQAAATVVAENIVKMYARLPARSMSRARFLITPQVMEQLPLLKIGDMPVWLPGGNMASAPFGTVMGRPIIPTEASKDLGQQGDVTLVDFSQYVWLTKRSSLRDGDGRRFDQSIHVNFDTNETAFRLTLRANGRPIWDAPMKPAIGKSYNRSPFVTLAVRS